MTDEVVVGSKRLAEKFHALSTELQGETLATAMKAGGLIILNAVKDNIKKQGLIRTRTLSRSTHEEIVEQNPERVVLEEGTDLEYAALHEFGGVITAKNGKYLAIPVGSYKDSPRKHPMLKIRKTIGGTLVLVSPSGQVQYVLKTSVTIEARPYMRPAYDEKKDEAVDMIGNVLKDQIKMVAEQP